MIYHVINKHTTIIKYRNRRVLLALCLAHDLLSTNNFKKCFLQNLSVGKRVICYYLVLFAYWKIVNNRHMSPFVIQRIRLIKYLKLLGFVWNKIIINWHFFSDHKDSFCMKKFTKTLKILFALLLYFYKMMSDKIVSYFKEIIII